MLTSSHEVVVLAARYRRSAFLVSVASFAGMAAVMALAAITALPKSLFLGGFALLFGTAIFAWGVVLLGSWFSKSRNSGGGVQGFADRSWRVFAGLFLVVWFGAGLLLVVVALVAIVAA
jgi:hypothetical protein